MATVLITIHLIVVLFLIVLVLLQRSEGGGLGIGGGGGMMTGRQAVDGLGRTTGVLAAAFFATSLGLGLLARYSDDTGGAFDRAEEIQIQQGNTGEGGVLDSLDGELPGTEPVVPADDTTGVPTGQ